MYMLPTPTVQVAYEAIAASKWPVVTKVKFDLRFEISNLNYPGIHVHVASNGHLHGLWGHDGLQTASITSNILFGIKFEIKNPNYPGIHVHTRHALF